MIRFVIIINYTHEVTKMNAPTTTIIITTTNSMEFVQLKDKLLVGICKGFLFYIIFDNFITKWKMV